MKFSGVTSRCPIWEGRVNPKRSSNTGLSPGAASVSTATIRGYVTLRGNYSGGLSWFQTEGAVQRGRNVNHVYCLEELVPGWGSTKCHSARRVFPYRNHYAGNFRRHRTTLKRFLNASLFRGRSLSERPIHRHDDYVLTIASQVRHLKGGHLVILLRAGLSHCYGDFIRRASASMSVFFLELSVFYHPPGPCSFRARLAALASCK
jgi:hypothetical protein